MRDYASAEPLLSASHVVHCHLIEYLTATGWIRYNTSGWDLDWNSKTWLAGHGVLGIEIAEEDVTLQVHGASVRIAALNPASVSAALSQINRGRPSAVYEVIFDDAYQIKEVVREGSYRLSTVELDKPEGNESVG